MGTSLNLEQFIDTGESLDAYVKRMRKSKEWGGQLEITAAANMFRVAIWIITNQPEPFCDIWIQPVSSVISDDVLLLGYDGQTCHYHSLQGKTLAITLYA